MIKDLKKIALKLAVPATVLFIILAFFYLPLQRDVLSKQIKLAAMEKEIQDLESLMDNKKSVGERVRIFRQRGEFLRAKFPPQEKKALRAIAQAALQFNLFVVSMQSQPPVDTLDELNQPLEIEGKKCRHVVVTVEMRGDFKNFLKFIDRLKNELSYFTVRRFSLMRDAQSPGKLVINFELNLYLLS